MGERVKLSSGSTLESEYAYSRAVVDGRWVMVSGTTGYDYATMTISPDPAAQAEQCFKNIAAALARADTCLSDIVRITYVVPNREDVAGLAPVFRRYLATVLPAATLLIAELLDPEMKIEIEVTALKP